MLELDGDDAAYRRVWDEPLFANGSFPEAFSMRGLRRRVSRVISCAGK